MNELERRDIRTEVRATVADDNSLHIVGKSPVFGKLSEDLGGWREVIEPTAFDGVIDQADVRGRFDHDLVLGRTKNGTMKLAKEPDGIAYDITINPDDLQAMSAYSRIKRGDVDGASFMFMVETDRWEQDAENNVVRHVIKASALLDVGPVAYPAYPDATAFIRSKIQQFQVTPAAPGPEGPDVAARQKARRRTLDLLSHSQPITKE
jgi:uncharacterized protein